MRVQHLNEGLIEIPPYIIKKARREILKYISTTMMKKTDVPGAFNGAPMDIYKSEKLVFKYYGDAYDLSDGDTLATPIKYYHEHVKYAEKENLTGEAIVMIGCSIDAKRSSTLGLYINSRGDDIVVINLYKLFRYLDDELEILPWIGGDLDVAMETNPESTQETIDYSIKTIDRDISKFMEYVDSTIEHEMGHVFQNKYFGKANMEVVPSSSGAYDYYASDIEFHPTLGGIVKNFKVFYDKNITDETPKEFISIVFKRLVGLDIPLPEWEKYNDYYNIGDLLMLMADRNFFQALYAKKPDKWKTAVKYLHTELNKLDIV